MDRGFRIDPLERLARFGRDPDTEGQGAEIFKDPGENDPVLHKLDPDAFGSISPRLSQTNRVTVFREHEAYAFGCHLRCLGLDNQHVRTLVDQKVLGFVRGLNIGRSGAAGPETAQGVASTRLRRGVEGQDTAILQVLKIYKDRAVLEVDVVEDINQTFPVDFSTLFQSFTSPDFS